MLKHLTVCQLKKSQLLLYVFILLQSTVCNMRLWTEGEHRVSNTSVAEQVKAFLVLQAAAADASTTSTRGNPEPLKYLRCLLSVFRL